MTTDPNMDPLDARLRHAMKALGDQASERYFEELPNRILTRLEESMQSDVDRPGTGAQAQKGSGPVAAAAPKAEGTDKQARQDAPAAPRQEDSGLHDIRALAQTTKQRLSQRKIPTQNPPVDPDILSSSSAGLRAVALPEPGRMVETRPIAMERASSPSLGDAPVAPTTIAAASAALPVAPAAAREIVSIATPVAARKRTGAVVAGAVLVAAAAGVAGFVALRKGKDAASTAEPVAAEAAPRGAAAEPAKEAAPAPTVTPIEPPTIAPQVAPATAASGAALLGDSGPVAGAPGGTGDDKAESADPTDRHREHDAVKAGAGGGKGKDSAKPSDGRAGGAGDGKKADGPSGPAGDNGAGGGAGAGKGDKQEQSLDDLLRGAGVDPDADKKKEPPKPDKKGLDADDIRKAMSALNGRAQGCYAKFGVAGSVGVKLTVAPSGEVKKAAVTGSFAGTPTGDCVADVVGGAKFPAWDGNVMTVSYSYFLTD